MSATARTLGMLAAFLLAFGAPEPAQGQDISLFLSLTQTADLPCFTGAQESTVADPAGKACGWTGTCPEPGCANTCIADFSGVQSIPYPAKGIATMVCPAIAMLVAFAQSVPEGATVSGRSLKGLLEADVSKEVGAFSPKQGLQMPLQLPGLPLSANSRQLLQDGSGGLDCPSADAIADSADIITQLADDNQAESGDNALISIMRFFDDVPSTQDYVMTKCTTEIVSGDLAVFYAELLKEDTAPESFSICRDSDGAAEQWVTDFSTYTQTCSFAPTQEPSVACASSVSSLFWFDTLEDQCALAWGNLLGFSATDMGELSSYSRAIVTECSQITTEVECEAHSMPEVQQFGETFLAALSATNPEAVLLPGTASTSESGSNTGSSLPIGTDSPDPSTSSSSDSTSDSGSGISGPSDSSSSLSDSSDEDGGLNSAGGTPLSLTSNGYALGTNAAALITVGVVVHAAIRMV